MTALEIQLPDDFEGKYEEFRMRVLGEYPKKPMINQNPAIPKFQLDWATNKLEEIQKEKELTERIVGVVENKLKNENPAQFSELPIVDYNPTTGKGKVNGIKKFRFKDGSHEHIIFNQLYSKIGKKLARHDVLIAGSFYKDYEEPDPTKKTLETAFINDRVTKIREKTGLDTEQLVNNAGNLTLVVEKPDKSGPKEVKHVAVWG